MPQQKHQDESQRGVESRLQTPEGLGHQQGPGTGRPPAGAGRDHPLGERGAGNGSRRAPRRPRGDRCRPRGAVRSASGARGRLARAPGGRVWVARAVDVRRQQQTPPGAHASVPRPSRCACAEAGHQRGRAGGRSREPGRPARGQTSRIAGAVLQARHSRARTRVLSSAEKLGGLQEHPLPSRRPGETHAPCQRPNHRPGRHHPPHADAKPSGFRPALGGAPEACAPFSSGPCPIARKARATERDGHTGGEPASPRRSPASSPCVLPASSPQSPLHPRTSAMRQPREVGRSPASHRDGREGRGSTPEPGPRPADYPAALPLIYCGGDRQVGLSGVAQVAAPKGKSQGRRDGAGVDADHTPRRGLLWQVPLLSHKPQSMWARPGFGSPGGPRRLFPGHWEPVLKEASPIRGRGPSTHPSPQAGPFPAISQRAATVCKGGAGARQT